MLKFLSRFVVVVERQCIAASPYPHPVLLGSTARLPTLQLARALSSPTDNSARSKLLQATSTAEPVQFEAAEPLEETALPTLLCAKAPRLCTSHGPGATHHTCTLYARAGWRLPRGVSPVTDTPRPHRGASHAPRPMVSVIHHPSPNACHHSNLLERFTFAFQCRQGKKHLVLTSQLWHSLCSSLWAKAANLRGLPASGKRGRGAYRNRTKKQ